MLNSTGDTDCKVNLRTNGLTGLSNLQILGLPAIIYNCTGADTVPPITSARSSRILKFSALPTPRPPDTRILASMISTVSDTALTTSLNGYIFVVRSKSGIVLIDTAFATCDRSDLLHNAGTNGCHLRSVVGAGDGSDGVTTECRTGHQQLVVLCSCPEGYNGKSPISSTVQSAVRPVLTLAETVGPRSRPIAVAPTRTISGLYFSITDASACA